MNRREVKEFTFQTEQWLPRPREEIFAFFGDARNLETITPPWLHIEVLTPQPIAMRLGVLIDYRLHIHGIPIRWRTEIVEWNSPHRFVDVQLRGPYALWHHTHIFEDCDGGTLCCDRVRYSPRGGRLMNWLFVRRDVERIFVYRKEKLTQIFRQKQMSIDCEQFRNSIKTITTSSKNHHVACPSDCQQKRQQRC